MFKKTTITIVLIIFILISCTEKKAQIKNDEYLYIGGLRYNHKLSELDKITKFRIELQWDEEYSNSLDGIELLLNLTELKIIGTIKNDSWQEISGIDFSPLKSLKDLKKLEILYISLNEIPDLSMIPSLEFIDFYRCKIMSLNGIEKANRIKRLEFSFWNDFLGDFTILSKLTELEKLTIGFEFIFTEEIKKYIFYVSDLSGMKSLKSLTLGNYTTVDLAGLNNLSELEYLRLSNYSRITNIQEIAQLQNLKGLHGLMIPYETSLNFLVPLINLIELDLDGSGNFIDIEILKNMNNLEYLSLSGFTIFNFHILNDLTKLNNVSTVGSKFIPEDNNRLKHLWVFYENAPP